MQLSSSKTKAKDSKGDWITSPDDFTGLLVELLTSHFNESYKGQQLSMFLQI